MAKKSRTAPEINASSMADIAFLLLIFFLVTTTIASDKGLSIRLPPKQDQQQDIKLKERNIFKVLVNSNNQLLVEGEYMGIDNLKDEAKKFIMNNGQDPESSESPEKAVISLKTDRGTRYDVYVKVMDELKKAYNELRAERMGITVVQLLAIENDPKQNDKNERLKQVRIEIPYQLSEAEPSDTGGN
ncbi:MAG: biopolymer transporter ExbD [Bernardetiaceae bacterium]|jgi:biopolymer transport protein ExbD|nr:biopolymer transporter ExbD [Bernardetiaceae bacterium]